MNETQTENISVVTETHDIEPATQYGASETEAIVTKSEAEEKALQEQKLLANQTFESTVRHNSDIQPMLITLEGRLSSAGIDAVGTEDAQWIAALQMKFDLGVIEIKEAIRTGGGNYIDMAKELAETVDSSLKAAEKKVAEAVTARKAEREQAAENRVDEARTAVAEIVSPVASQANETAGTAQEPTPIPVDGFTKAVQLSETQTLPSSDASEAPRKLGFFARIRKPAALKVYGDINALLPDVLGEPQTPEELKAKSFRDTYERMLYEGLVPNRKSIKAAKAYEQSLLEKNK